MLKNRVSDSLGVVQSPRICISTRFPGVSDAAAWGTILENQWEDETGRRRLFRMVGGDEHLD